MTQASGSVWYKKALLLTLSFLLMLPIVIVPMSLLFGGIFIWGSQTALYRRDGQWRSFSTFELATQTVDGRLAEKLYLPRLSSCRETYTRLLSNLSQDRSGAAEWNTILLQECPQLGRWQSSLLYPASQTGHHKIAAPVLSAIPVSLLLVMTGLMILYLLGITRMGF